MSIWTKVSFKACVFLLTFFLDDLPIGISEVLNPSNFIVLLWSFPLWLLAFALYTEVLLRWVHMYVILFLILLGLVP